MTALLPYSAAASPHMHMAIRWWSTPRATSTPPGSSGAQALEM